MSAKFAKDAHGDIACDPNGQVVLSRDDHDFIREKAEAAGTIRVPGGNTGSSTLHLRRSSGQRHPEGAPPLRRMRLSRTTLPRAKAMNA